MLVLVSMGVAQSTTKVGFARARAGGDVRRDVRFAKRSLGFGGASVWCFVLSRSIRRRGGGTTVAACGGRRGRCEACELDDGDDDDDGSSGDGGGDEDDDEGGREEEGKGRGRGLEEETMAARLGRSEDQRGSGRRGSHSTRVNRATTSSVSAHHQRIYQQHMHSELIDHKYLHEMHQILC